jgi:hypothetical protein
MVYPATLAYDTSTRAELVGEMQALTAELEKLRGGMDESEPRVIQLDLEEGIVDRLLHLRHLYRDTIPFIPLSRCPYTGQELHYGIDTYGLDGPWWDYYDPVRPEQGFPPTTFALTGAILLASDVEPVPEVVILGPGAPYVIPRLLGQDDTAAVVSSLSIGAHQGLAIAYFGSKPRSDRPVVNEWGTGRWLRQNETPANWDQEPLVIEECDFELEPWLEAERLLWIAPGDSSLELNLGANGCPYLDHGGQRQLISILEGSVR